MAFLAPVGGIRTVWILIRGQNYAQQAMRSAQKGLDDLQRAQMRFREDMTRMIHSGILYVAMTTMLAASLLYFASRTRYAATLLREFNVVGKKFADIFGKEFILAIRPFLNVLIGLMRYLMENRAVLQLLIKALIGLMIVGTVLGLFRIFSAVIAMFTMKAAWLCGPQGTLVRSAEAVALLRQQGITCIPVVNSLAMSIQSVVSKALMFATIFMTISSVLGKVPAIIASVVVAIIALTIAVAMFKGILKGPAVLADLAASLAAGAIIGAAMTAAMPAYQQGTRFVRRTGPAMVHEGEEVVPATERKYGWQSPYRKPRGFGRGPSVVNITTNVDKLMTEADEEELGKHIFNAAKKAIDDAEYGD